MKIKGEEMKMIKGKSILKTLLITLLIVFTCFGYSQSYASSVKSIKDLKVKVDTSIHTYNGSERRTSVKIYDGKKKLKDDIDYTLEYKYAVNPGKARVIIRGIGKYSGKIKKEYYIAPPKAKIYSVTFNAKQTRATITWRKENKASGYRIYMSESKDGEYVRIRTLSDKNFTSYTKGGLDPNKEYYFKVRAYKQYGDKRICKKYSEPKTNTGLVSSTSLNSPTSGTNRNYNLWKACSTINGKVIYPGQTFNWFRDHGPASAARGYRQATVFEGTKSVLGYGGGVCQVSSTIYQAARKIGLQIVERHQHSKTVSYTTLGNDATVSYGSNNLIIRNNKSYPIKLVMSASGGRTTCQIYKISN